MRILELCGQAQRVAVKEVSTVQVSAPEKT